MILSSADILRILSGDAMIRQEAKIYITEGRPGLGTEDAVYIYIDKYPTVDEFEATWSIWVQDNSGMGRYVLNAMTALLPNFDFNGKHYTTTDFASERTVIKTQEEIEREEFRSEFSDLQKGLQDRMSAVRNGRDGIDGKDGLDGLAGKDGRDGRDGKDGRDLVATDARLFDLQDADQSVLPMEKGQVLTWDGGKWTNLYVAQFSGSGGGSGGGSSSVQVLDDLTDVNAPTPNNGDIISYNSTSGNWETVAAPPADISANSIDDLADVDTTTSAPAVGQTLKWDGTNWSPADDSSAVASVNGQTGVVVLDAADVGAATTAQGALADTAVQPGDNVSTLTNDAGYITDAGVTQIVAGTNVTIDPVGGTGAVTINATGGGTGDADGGDFGPLPDPDGGDFEAGTTTSTLAYPVDGGDFEVGTTGAFGDSSFDGGEVT